MERLLAAILAADVVGSVMRLLGSLLSPRSDAHCATIIGNWEGPSGESRLGSIRGLTVVDIER